MIEILKVKLDEGAYKIERAYSTDAGYDLRTPIDFTVPAHGSSVVDSGVHVLISKGYVGMLKSKSGLNVKHNITGEGTVDAHYVGAIKVKLFNHGDDDYSFKRGDKIIQLVVMPIATPEIEIVDELPETDRGSNGFGSTGYR